MEYGKKIRLGGFHLLKYKKDDMTFIKVSTIMGNWAMEYREDALLYPLLDKDRTEDEDKALNYLVVNAFMAANLAEADFQHEILEAAGRLQERINKGAEKVSDEEDAEILKTMKTETEMIEHLNGEEGKTEAEV